MNNVLLNGKGVETLFASLDETNAKLAGASLFGRGAKGLQGPLRNMIIPWTWPLL